MEIGLIDPSTGTLLTDSSSTHPTTAMLTYYIENAQTHIERLTWKSWRAKSTNDYEYYNVYDNNVNNSFGYAIIQGIFFVAIKLNHEQINTPVSGTDYFEYFDGSDWIDLIANKTVGSGFGEGDYWIEPENGIIYLFTILPTYGRSTFKAKYRYGYSSVPEDIREATAKLAAIDVIGSDWFKRSFPNSAIHENSKDYKDRLQKKADSIIDSYRGLQFVW
jgi:hypothetical protein